MFVKGTRTGTNGRPKGHAQRTIDLINVLVRVEQANPQLTYLDVARLIGIKTLRYERLRKLPIYQTIKNQHQTGLISRLDTKVSDHLSLTQETLSYAVPLAMQTIVLQALNAKDERIRNKAANDILDRDGHFAKVSRVGMATEQQGGVAKEADNETAKNLMSALNKEKALGVIPIDGGQSSLGIDTGTET